MNYVTLANCILQGWLSLAFQQSTQSILTNGIVNFLAPQFFFYEEASLFTMQFISWDVISSIAILNIFYVFLKIPTPANHVCILFYLFFENIEHYKHLTLFRLQCIIRRVTKPRNKSINTIYPFKPCS